MDYENRCFLRSGWDPHERRGLLSRVRSELERPGFFFRWGSGRHPVDKWHSRFKFFRADQSVRSGSARPSIWQPHRRENAWSQSLYYRTTWKTRDKGRWLFRLSIRGFHICKKSKRKGPKGKSSLYSRRSPRFKAQYRYDWKSFIIIRNGKRGLPIIHGGRSSIRHRNDLKSKRIQNIDRKFQDEAVRGYRKSQRKAKHVHRTWLLGSRAIHRKRFKDLRRIKRKPRPSWSSNIGNGQWFHWKRHDCGSSNLGIQRDLFDIFRYHHSRASRTRWDRHISPHFFGNIYHRLHQRELYT